MRGLDWFTFFLADIQTGFGPFVAVYLTAQAWTQSDIGFVLTAGALVALVGQIPGGALIDAARSTRIIAAIAVLAIGASAIAIASSPLFSVVMGARIMHAGASCLLGPTIAALSIGIAGHAALGERLGRNARFASVGAGIAAFAMGATGQLYSSQAVFILTGLLVIPALGALSRIRIARTPSRLPLHTAAATAGSGTVGALFTNRRLMVFAAAIVTFHLANAAMLPLMGGVFAGSSGSAATMWIAGCMIVPQLIVAACSPWVGRKANIWGWRPLLVLCFAALVLRGILFALTSEPAFVVAAQAFDGISAAVLAVLFPLIIADITRDTGRFNLALGIVGSAMGIGAALSTMIAGMAFDQFGGMVTFLGLATVAATGLVVVLLLMPETRPEAAQRYVDRPASP